MVHSINAKGELGFVSDMWLEKLGYTRPEVAGRPSTDFMTAASRLFAKEKVLPAFFETGRCNEVPYQFVSKSGEVIDVLLSAILRRKPDGTPSHTLAFLQDVTTLRNAERVLNDKQERLAAIIDGTRAGTWEWNVQTGETRFNEEWASIVGYTLDELQPTTIDTWMDLAHPDDLQKSGDALEAHFSGQTDFYECDARMKHKDGHWVWVNDRGSVLTRTPDGQPEWVFGTHLDITERVQQEQSLRRNEALLEQTGRMAGVGGWEIDLKTKEIVWTDEACRIHGVPLGYEPSLEEAIQFYAPEARAIIEAAVETAMESGEGWDLQLPFIKRGGTRIWVRAQGRAEHDSDGKPIRLIGAFQDITDRMDQTNELQLAQQRVVLATQSGGIGIWEYDLLSNEVKLDSTMKALFDVDDRRSSVSLKSWLSNLVTADRNEMSMAIRRAILTKEAIDKEVVVESATGNRNLVVSASAHLGSDQLVERLVGVAWDITEKRRLMQEMEHLAQHDTLTGLCNRYEFEKRLGDVLKKKQPGRASSVIMVDLDRFKPVNDTGGHETGDRLLKDLGRVFQSCVEKMDTVARIGGDEFAIILAGGPERSAIETAQLILEQVTAYRLETPDGVFRVGASLGVVQLTGSWTDVDMVMKAADTTCYRAKNSGRGRVAVWDQNDPDMVHLSQQMIWATRVERAIDDKRLTVYEQHIAPILEGAGNPMHELLVRLVEEDGTVVDSADFILAVEQYGLAPRIDTWMFEHAIDYAKRLVAEGAPDLVSVNASAQTIMDATFQTWLMDRLGQLSQDVASRICLEITEASAISNLETAADLLAELRRHGVSTALDDFGAGATSFRYLTQLPLDYLKIDGRIVSDISRDDFNASIVRCLVDMARAAGIKTVAEWVEDQSILERVTELDVDFAQGFHIEYPKPVDQGSKAAA